MAEFRKFFEILVKLWRNYDETLITLEELPTRKTSYDKFRK